MSTPVRLILRALAALLPMLGSPSVLAACPDSIRAIDLEKYLVADYAPDPAQCLHPIRDGRTVQLFSVQYGDLDGDDQEEAVVRAQSCYMGTGGADISDVFKLECSSDGSDWSLARIPVEEVAYDEGPGRPRAAPWLKIEGKQLVSSSALYRFDASDPEPTWQRIVTYTWLDGRFAIESVVTRELDEDGS